MNVIRSTYQEFLEREQESLPAFESALDDFHADLRAVEGMGLMVPVEDYGKWYSAELLKGAEESLPHVTEMAYMKDGIGKILAFALWRADTKPKPGEKSDWSPVLIVDLLELYVSPELRGKGVGRMLTTIAEEDAKSKGADYFAIDVLAKNEAAVGLYLSMGLTPWFISMTKKI